MISISRYSLHNNLAPRVCEGNTGPCLWAEVISGAGDCTVSRLSHQGAHLIGQRHIGSGGHLPLPLPRAGRSAGLQTRLLRGVPVSVAPAPRPLELDAGIRGEAVVIPSEAG